MKPIFLLLALICLLVAACNPVGPSQIVFTNESQCGTIRATLKNTTNGVESNADIASGQKVTIQVTPDVYYDYVVDFTKGEPFQKNTLCTGVESGKLRVSPGASQNFLLRAEPGTATP